MRSLSPVWTALLLAATNSCVPPGSSANGQDAGGAPAPNKKQVKEAENVLKQVFSDNFERPADAPQDAAIALLGDAAPRDGGAWTEGGRADVDFFGEGAVASGGSELGPNWAQAGTSAWRIENGRLCGKGAHNHGVWFQKPIPMNARIEFTATSASPDGDLKVEVWGDGRSAATAVSYTNATSYLVIFGGWKNTVHVIARINEHGKDRKEVKVDPEANDFRKKPVSEGQTYRFRIERTDGKTVRWFVDGTQMLTLEDAEPLAGIGHDHFGFNNWEVPVCFDDFKVTPL